MGREERRCTDRHEWKQIGTGGCSKVRLALGILVEATHRACSSAALTVPLFARFLPLRQLTVRTDVSVHVAQNTEYRLAPIHCAGLEVEMGL